MKTDMEWIDFAESVKTKLGDGPLAAQVLHEVGKDLRMKDMNESRKAAGNEPTEKQISYAKKLGIEKPGSYTKDELSNKIDEIVKK